MNEYSREKIKLRMLRRIASLWDISDVEHVDPVVKLLIEAMAEEVFMLAGEVSDLDDRMMAKLSVSMTPVTCLTARPAHAILSAMPTDTTVRIDSDTIFEYKESRLLRRYNLNSIFFTPVAPFELIRAKVNLLSIGNRLYRCDRDCRKNLVALAEKDDEYFRNTVWIGLELSPDITGKHDLCFYFDFAQVEDAGKYLRLLPYTRWTIDGKEPEITQGLDKEAQDGELRSLYDLHYITLQDVSTDNRKPYPDEWELYYAGEALAGCSAPLLWMKMAFPESIPGDVLEHLKVGINMFPVANISKRTMTRKMTDVSMFMPLHAGKNEYFVRIDSVKDSSGKVYESLSGDAGGATAGKGIYSLRRGGVETYSHTNDSKSAILRLVDIITDRHMFSHNKTEAELEQMVDKVLVLTDRISNMVNSLNGETDSKSYIVVDRTTPGETLIADYWVTNGEVINNFKPIVPLYANGHSAALEEGIYFLTPVRGGSAPPSIDRIKDLHRYMLTSHDRIFTKHDIVNFCKAEYGHAIEDVEVKPGVAIGLKPRQGVMKTIDVYIKRAAARSDLSGEELRKGLMCKLEARSPDSFNYRIFITN